VCGIADARVLRRHRLKDGLVVLCANHAAIAGRRGMTLTELRGECCPPGDRRAGSERRQNDRRTTTRRGKRASVGTNGERRRRNERRLGTSVSVGTS
jgi:hypothetical protein